MWVGEFRGIGLLASEDNHVFDLGCANMLFSQEDPPDFKSTIIISF